MSLFEISSISFPAFSGLGNHKNKKASACIPDHGPIPPGEYYIFDRKSGGLLGSFRDMFNDHKTWFALHAIDEKIDDETYCDMVKRGYFRLHPKGDLGISQGCITIEKMADFQHLRSLLRSTTPTAIPGSTLLAYGKVTVK